MRTDCLPFDSGCHGCGAPFPLTKKGTVPKNRAWCTAECERRVRENHWWQAARYAALRRDGYKCVVCDATEDGDKGRAYRKRAWQSYLEVNHIMPVNGRRKHWDCSNHLDNLETLCHDCHVAVTKQQRRDGLLVSRVRHWIVFVRLESGTSIFCKRCGLVVSRDNWVQKRREDCPAGTLKSQRKPLRQKRKRR